jgi:hypothetical protein
LKSSSNFLYCLDIANLLKGDVSTLRGESQVGRNRDQLEAEWRAAHPAEEPGRALSRGWDAAAWAIDRPDKIVPVSADALHSRWLDELHALGYRPPRAAVPLGGVRAGELDREGIAGTVLVRLAARRSAWNPADVRGEVEHALARTGLVAGAGVRIEVAEDITARTVAACVPLLPEPGMPEHIRALTSPQVLAVEADLGARIAARTTTSGRPEPAVASVVAGLDSGQRHAADLLAGKDLLVLVEGAAGVGKTTVLAAARDALLAQGRGLIVVTPTLKAAQAAGSQVGSPASSVARLVHQHGYRWDDDGRWTRLRPGEVDPATGSVYRGPDERSRLRAGDLLLVDEAGMLDQDTALALFTVADEHQVRLALIGDRRQLPAIGRGGVLDIAARWTPPRAHVVLESVHRFTDSAYAEVSLAMRSGTDPGGVFDALAAQGHVRIYPTDRDRTAALAAQAMAAGREIVVAADTRAQAAELNAAIQQELIALGRVDHGRAVTTQAGERLGVGDRVATRRNDPVLGVANRDTWTVTAARSDGALAVTGRPGDRVLPAGYVADRVELAYATTIHGAQGDTAAAGHLVLGEHTTAQAAYVGMTRGRHDNTLHVVARDLDAAREQWVTVFDRQRSDLGPAAAAQAARLQAANYASHRPLEEVLKDLREAWTRQADSEAVIARERRLSDYVTNGTALAAAEERLVTPLFAAYYQAEHRAAAAEDRFRRIETAIETDTDTITADLRWAWHQQRPEVRRAARSVLEGSGPFGLRHRQVHDATAVLQRWAATWQPVIGALPDALPQLAVLALGRIDPQRLDQALTAHAQHLAGQAHPDLARARDDAARAGRDRDQARRDYDTTTGRYYAGHDYAPNPEALRRAARDLHDLQPLAAVARTALAHTRARIAELTHEPALRAAGRDVLNTERALWAAEHTPTPPARRRTAPAHTVAPAAYSPPAPSPGRGISR